jgi:hypothetical protein
MPGITKLTLPIQAFWQGFAEMKSCQNEITSCGNAEAKGGKKMSPIRHLTRCKSMKIDVKQMTH